MKFCYNNIKIGDVLWCYCDENQGLYSGDYAIILPFEVVKFELTNVPVVISKYTNGEVGVIEAWIHKIVKSK